MFLELTALALTVFLVYHFFFEFPSNNLPPGPRPWPLIGNLNMLSKNIHLSLTELGAKYGKIFCIYVGHRPIAVVCGDAIKEALVRKPSEFAGRPTISYALQTQFPEGPGVPLMDYGPRWRLLRKLGHQAIKVYGEDRLQKTIGKEVEELCKRLESTNGRAIDVVKQFGIAVTNIICTKIIGSRYDVRDPEFLKLYEIHDQLTRTPAVALKATDILPFLRYVLPFPADEKRRIELARQRYALLREKYYQHLETFDPQNIKDYTDALIKCKQEAEEEDKSSKEHLQEGPIIMGGLATLFTAGSETTTTTLSWAVIYLLHNPGLQDRLHNEISKVIGLDGVPMLSHKKDLPLLEAFTAETLRMANLLPVSIPHKTTKDVSLLGYTIPVGTTVLANTWGLHHDSSIFKDPYKFSLERFLDASGKFCSPPGGDFLPFGAGPRVCLGEVLARSELFSFLSRLLQRFRFVNPSGFALPSTVGEQGIVLHPSPFKVCVHARN